MNILTFPDIVTPDIVEDTCYYLFPYISYDNLKEDIWPSLSCDVKQKLDLLSQRMEFISQLKVIGKDIKHKHTYNREIKYNLDYTEVKENLLCDYLSYDFNGTHFDIEALNIYLLITCIDTIAGTIQYKDPFEYILDSIQNKNISKEKILEIKAEYKQKFAITKNFINQFIDNLSNKIKMDWLENFMLAKTISNINKDGKILEYAKICETDMDKWKRQTAPQKIKKIAEELFTMRSKFTHISIRSLLRTIPITSALYDHPLHLVKIGNIDLDILLIATVRDLARKMMENDYQKNAASEYHLFIDNENNNTWQYGELIPKKISTE